MSKFYKIDFEREVVVQGKSSSFLTIARNDDGLTGSIPSDKSLVILIYPQANTFESHGKLTGLSYNSLSSTGGTAAFSFTGTSNPSGNDNHFPKFNRISSGLLIKNWYEMFSGLTAEQGPLKIASYEGNGISVTTANSSYTGSLPVPNSPVPTIEVGKYVIDSSSWKINGADPQVQVNTLELQQDSLYWVPFDQTQPNPFDGSENTSYSEGTGFYSRPQGFWVRINYDGKNVATNGVTFRIDYDGVIDSHLKLNFLIVAIGKEDTSPLDLINAADLPIEPYGSKSAAPELTDYDYQEVHLFGYKEDYVRPYRNIAGVEYPIQSPVYDDNASYGLIKTNPKISGNVKLTVDSTGEIWLNSFDATQELADSKYKRYGISSNSTYQNDLYSFFDKGQTPADIVFSLYQADDQYLNTKRTYDQQYDNFYNYGVEQLRSKFYDEDFTFLAPLWLRKDVPEYFVIFRINNPVNYDSYQDTSTDTKFNDFFKEARIVKTYDLRSSSKIGSYLRKIVEDERYKERPLEVSWESDVATYWNGIAYKNATITSKGEFLYDYYKQDRPIKEFEQYITEGFERNSLISANLINLEFLFDDDEAPMYGINRYFGFYVKENQLAEFELEPRALGNISGQTPPPKPGVDGGPSSSREFVQTNPNGVQLPVHYFHSTRFTNNTTNVPTYQGNVVGKFPLPSMVDDPLRFFYVKDRNDEFKRVNKLTEVDTGSPGETEFVRTTNLQLFDTSEDISNYSGVTDITSQVRADLLGPGNAQLVLALFDQKNTGVLADDEELVFTVDKYNNPIIDETYYLQVSAVSGSNVTLEYFANQNVGYSSSGGLTQPAVGATVTVSVNLPDLFTVNQQVYIPVGGYYLVEETPAGTSNIVLRNLGYPQNASPGTPNAITNSTWIAQYPSGVFTVDFSDTLDDVIYLDNTIQVQLDSTVIYAVGNSWRIIAEYPSIKTYINIGGNGISSSFARSYTRFTWRMIANSTALNPGDAWDYPVADPNKNDYVSNFSNAGTPQKVAQAIATCIKNFENIPVSAIAVEDKVYLVSNLKGDEGNDIKFSRNMRSDSYYANLGFYEIDTANRNITITQPTLAVNNSPLSQPDLKPILLEQNDKPGSQSYWINIIRSGSSYTVWGRLNCDSSSYESAISTGESFFVVTTETLFTYPGLPLKLDISKIADNTALETLYKLSAASTIEQKFIGGNKRTRNRIRISQQDGTNYYADRRQEKTGKITKDTYEVFLDTDGIYIGAPISGAGIQDGTLVTDINKGLILISKPATESNDTALIDVGGITIANTTPITQQWFQTQKVNYSKIKGWDVQGKFIYSLPYLDDPYYDENNYLSGFYRSNDFSIVQIEKPDEEIYISSDLTAVAYKVFRPVFGLFSLYPVKEFDFDFIFSDYSYTPTLEAETYFKKTVVKSGDTIELPLFENFQLTQYFYALDEFGKSTGTSVPPILDKGTQYTLYLDAYNPANGNWYRADTVSVALQDIIAPEPVPSSSVVINTFYPLYDYDVTEYPFMSLRQDETNPPPYDTNYQFRGAGIRNYDRRYLRTYDPLEQVEITFYPEKFRLTYVSNAQAIDSELQYYALEVENYNYKNDRDLKTFTGFAGLQDVENVQDNAKIQSLRESGEYLSSYTYQLLLSEYDRLRENYTKDFAVTSKVVPYINKWVQEGTDARDNYYRLNTSLAFGINNLSPNEDVDFVEASVLTNEFPYLDVTPKDYPTDSFENSRSYMFGRLSDTVYDGKSWLQLLTADSGNDWFTKYFAIGYPSEISFSGNKIGKSREERYTFFRYNVGAERSQSLFRGGKVEIVSYSDVDPLNITEITESTQYDGYKFSAIARFVRNEFYQLENPVDIEVIKNDTYKSVLLLITVRISDYRLQHGHVDYMLQYFMSDTLKNSNQQQLYTPYLANASTQLRNFLPYVSTYDRTSSVDSQVLRNRQGFLGGGYLQLGDKKLGGVVNYTPKFAPLPLLSNGLLSLYLKPVSSSYVFNLQKEQSTIQNNYKVDPLSYPFLTNIGLTGSIIPKEFGQDGYLFNLHTTSVNAKKIVKMRSAIDAQNLGDTISPTTASFGAANRTPFFRVVPETSVYEPGKSGMEARFTAQENFNGFENEKETYSLEGGTQAYDAIKNYLTFANIKALLNNGSTSVSYYKVVNNQKQAATDYSIRIVSGDPVVKSGVVHFTTDEDKPQEYLNKKVIGYNFAQTRTQEYIVRHRGSYEPKTRDVISFWVREENSVNSHFEKDFLLSNTRINSSSALSGLVKNYGINKVATSGEVLKIARGSSYESLYPLIGEVAVDSWSRFALDGSWDDKFYRNYDTTTSFTEVEGIVEMQELKSFLASKAMNIPKSHEMHTYNETEATFTLTPPAVSIGLNTLVKKSATRNQTKESGDKSILKININVKDRLLRQLIEDINSGNYVDEFSILKDSGIAPLSNLTAADVEKLKTIYLEKNIIGLYEVTEINLYAKERQGIRLVDLSLTEQGKEVGGYRIDKNCAVKKISDFVYEITKTLDPRAFTGFGISAVVKRI